jgi:hypothetical protein
MRATPSMPNVQAPPHLSKKNSTTPTLLPKGTRRHARNQAGFENTKEGALVENCIYVAHIFYRNHAIKLYFCGAYLHALYNSRIFVEHPYKMRHWILKKKSNLKKNQEKPKKKSGKNQIFEFCEHLLTLQMWTYTNNIWIDEIPLGHPF